MIHSKSSSLLPRRGRMPAGVTLALLAVLCAATAGCTRKYWRKQADELSYNLIRDKQSDPRWAVERVMVETDPRSRFFEAFDPDYEPLLPTTWRHTSSCTGFTAEGAGSTGTNSATRPRSRTPNGS